ncbi:unnamed protein product [Caenorhabditis angaria]|uniref:Uncharacterized protein n=1 Tax=Caenorhabditis angaria TaxID=860376 RepID=A0A9P1N9V2_9PELO|nr:unnamed protein product [Caenorhabditis angaria]
MFAYTFAVISVHFLYRYFAICKHHWLSLFFKPRFICLTICSVLLYGSSYILLIAIFMWPNEETRLVLDLDFIQKYNETTKNIPFFIGTYGPESDRSGLISMGSAAIILLISLIFDAILAKNIHYSIKNLNLSDNVKKIHRNLLITLIIQTTIPSILTFFPCLIIWFYPFLNLDFSYYSNSIFVPMVNCYPFIDPIVITLALNDYRMVVFKCFKRPTQIHSYNTSTFFTTVLT